MTYKIRSGSLNLMEALKKSVLVLTAAAAIGPLSTGVANAMPVAPAVSGVDQIDWVCNEWGRCWSDYPGYGYRYRSDDDDGPATIDDRMATMAGMATGMVIVAGIIVGATTRTDRRAAGVIAGATIEIHPQNPKVTNSISLDLG
jgi:hypothetical protein